MQHFPDRIDPGVPERLGRPAAGLAGIIIQRLEQRQHFSQVSPVQAPRDGLPEESPA